MRGSPSYVGPFTGGLNTRDSPMEIPITHSPDCIDVIGNKDGSIRKRNPCILVTNTFTGAGANNISALFYSRALTQMIVVVNQKVYSVNPTTGVSADITGAFPITLVNPPSAFVDAPVSGGQGPVYALTGDATSNNFYWTGAGNIAQWTASAGTLPRAHFMVYFKNRIILAGSQVGTSGTGILASKVGDPRAFDTTLSGASEAWLTNIDPNDGDFVTGLGTIGQYLIVFKSSKIYVVYDLDTGANRPIHTSIGCLSPRTITSTPYGLTWLANDGHVYITDGSKIERVSDILSPPAHESVQSITVQSLGYNSGGTILSRQSAGFYFDNRYYVSTEATNSTPCTFVYDYKMKSWWKYSPAFTQFATDGFATMYGARRNVTVPQTALWKLFVTKASSGSNEWQDPIGAYGSYYTTPPVAPAGKGQNPNLRRRYHALRGWASGVVDVQMCADQLDNPTPTYTTLLNLTSFGLASDVDFPSEYTAYSMGVANVMRFKFASPAASTKAFEVHPFQIYTQPRTD